MKEFIDKYVNSQESYAVDTYQLQQITGWDLDLEVLDKDNSEQVHSLGQSSSHSLFKLFGYARSQQSVQDYYCVNSFFGPRFMNTFLTFFSQDHDNFIQVYADILMYNLSSNNDNTLYLKTDISST